MRFTSNIKSKYKDSVFFLLHCEMVSHICVTFLFISTFLLPLLIGLV